MIKYLNRKSKELLTEHPPAESWLKLLYSNRIAEKTVLPIIKKKFFSFWYGKKMDAPSSIKKIAPFIKEFNINVDELEKDVTDFSSFNDFFCRKLKPGSRIINNGLISPGDGRLLAFENVEQIGKFYIKGSSFTLDDFLLDKELASNYNKSSMIILRLAPNDYHRFHFPYSGIPSVVNKIEGSYYSVSPIATIRHFTKVFCENKREVCRLKIKNDKEILIVSIGSTLVGSIKNTYLPCSRIQKGDEMGCFLFGGSTIVMLFDKTLFRINPDLLSNTNSQIETFVEMGDELAVELFD